MSHCILISDAAKEVRVESHVLRYWEEELHLPIKRNELGHRYYTEEDVERFKQIKSMKERGLQLKAIKMILKNGKLDVLGGENTDVKIQFPTAEKMESQIEQENIGAKVKEDSVAEDESVMAIHIVDKTVVDMQSDNEIAENLPSSMGEAGILQGEENKEDKSRKLQWLLQEMIKRAVQENNAELCRELKESIIKELDYQFRMQEEREEIREKRLVERDELYYRKMDELLRKKTRLNRFMKAGAKTE